MLSELEAKTLAYYDDHADDFLKSTLTVDMHGLYEPFLACVPAQGRILDVGCGSGRDSAAFLKLGYSVVSIDAAPKMVQATTKLTGQPAFLMRFDELAFDNEFDGVWACASLLHVPRPDLQSVLVRVAVALKPAGVMYASFKYGDCERVGRRRYFNDLDEDRLHQFVASVSGLDLMRMWGTEDVRPDRNGQKWLNAIARKKERDVR